MWGKLFLTAILATTPAFAQRGSGGGQSGALDTSAQRAQPIPKSVQLAERLKLNKDQKEKAQAILVDANKEMAQVRTRLNQQRVQIANSVLGNGSQDDFNKLMEDYAAAEAQMTSIEVQAFAKICALLKPDQMTKAGSAFDLLAAVLDPPGSATSGGGRRGKH